MVDIDNSTRSIRSFVKREGRLTKSQKSGLENYWAKYGIDFQQKPLDIEMIFSRRAPTIVDIGVGTGESTLHHARIHPENNYLAIEVHRPGIGQLLNKIEKHELHNIRIIQDDVINVLEHQLPDRCISQFFIFFPDPWPKKRHHKRRLINTELLQLISNKITFHGRLHIATDWEDYADHIKEVVYENSDFINLAGNKHTSPRPDWRIQTRYENRGQRLKHKVWDFCYSLSTDDKQTSLKDSID